MRIGGKDTFSISVESYGKLISDKTITLYLTCNLYPLTTQKEFLQQRHTATHPAHGLGDGLHHTPDQTHFAGRLVQSHHDVIHRLLHELSGLGDGVVGMRRLGDTVSWLHFLSEGNTATWHDSVSSAGEACVSLEDKSPGLNLVALKPCSHRKRNTTLIYYVSNLKKKKRRRAHWFICL